MQQFAMFLSSFASIYMFIIVARIILTWFSRNIKAPEILIRVTDPYLNWFRRFTFLRIGHIDLSPIAALMVLSITNQILVFLAQYGTITLGLVLALIIQALWSAISFILVVLIIIMVLRLIAHITSRDVFTVFWRVIDIISQQVLSRVNNYIFRGRTVGFAASALVSVGILFGMYVLFRVMVSLFLHLLLRLPV
jgi:YggT family protein